MSLNEVLWSKLDLSKFGSLDNVETFDIPQVVAINDLDNHLQYGNGIFYAIDNDRCNVYLMHASCKQPEACNVVWSIYVEYHKVIDEILCVTTIINNVNPAKCGNIFSREIIDKYGRYDHD